MPAQSDGLTWHGPGRSFEIRPPGYAETDSYRRPERVTATSTFNIRIIHAYAALPIPLPLPPVNLVGNHCTTATPVSVTMSGIAHLGAASTFSGTFTIPDFKSCGAATAGLNLLIPGPGNTFTATTSP